MSVPSLAELQATMQASILGRDDGALVHVAAPAHGTARTRLRTYQNAYVIRLCEILGEDYGQLHSYLGDEQFGALAQAYVAAHPSDHPDARWFGRHMASFLSGQAPWSGAPVLADLAALEWALGEAFDAPNAAVAGRDSLGAIDAARVETMTVTLHPSVRRIDLVTNADAILAALKQGTEPPSPITLDEPQRLLVWRKGNGVRHATLGAEEAMLANLALAGTGFGAMCQMAAMMADPDNAAARVAGVLCGWLDEGIVSLLSA